MKITKDLLLSGNLIFAFGKQSGFSAEK